jgi:fibronectin-binding autotransporter adhesin
MAARKFHVFIALGCVAFAARGAFAQQIIYNWNVLGGGAATWQNAANWDPNTAFPNAATDDANLSVGLTSGLVLDILGTDVTVGNLTIGGTAGPVVTDIVGSGGALFLNDTSGNATIFSYGTTGGTNVVSAPLVLSDGTTELDASSTQPFFIGSTLSLSGANQTLITNGSAALTIGSNPGGVPTQIQLYERGDDTIARNLTINNVRSTSTGGLDQSITVNGKFQTGTAGTGTVTFGSNSNSGAKYYMSQTQDLTTTVNIGRQSYYLNVDNPFGTGNLVANNSNESNWGGLLISDNDARTVGNAQVQVGNNFAVAGDNSLTFTGAFGVTNNRNVGNNLAAGKTWELAGTVYPNIKAGDLNSRTITFDGPGRTLISGVLANTIADDTISGNITQRGSGSIVLTNSANTISGTITTGGGMIVFDADGSYGATTGGAGGTGSTIVANTSGGVSYTPGTGDAGWATFAGKLTGGSGYLALPAGDAAANLDFSAGVLANAPGLSVTGNGALTYTGTVTPGASGYRWGGPQGQLTLGSNAGTGANAVTYTNGGDVVVNGTPDYTGVTTIQGTSYSSAQVYITNGQRTNGTQTFYLPTTLEVSSLGDGGSASSLGASSADAANLVIDRATLVVNSSTATSTDRLFTIGSAGATIESAGTGLVTIGSGGGANVAPVSTTLTLTGTGDGTLGSALGGAGQLSLVKSGTGTWSLNETNTYTGNTTVQAGTLIVNGALGSGAVTVDAGALLSMGAGSTLAFSTAGPTVTSNGNMSFASGFGVANLVGLDDTIGGGTYTLVAGTVDTSNLSNVGQANAYSYGSVGSTAYFLPGSLNLVVVPEPTSIAVFAAGAALLGWRLRRRTAA